MKDDRICAIIIDSDVDRVKDIKSFLPDYIDLHSLKYSDANGALKNGIEGRRVMLVILDADDKTGMAKSLFRYISDNPDRLKLYDVATVLLASDEFSDSSLEYYDIGDPYFYTGMINETDFYMAVMEALDDASLREEEIFPEPEVTGKASDDVSETDEKQAPVENTWKQRPPKERGEKWLRKEKPVDDAITKIHKISDAAKVESLLSEDTVLPKLLIVEDDENVVKAMRMFLTNYDIENVTSNIKAIDYIVKNHVDVVAIEHNLNGMPGLSIYNSIKNQPNGANVIAFIIMEDNSNQFEIESVESVPGITGVITKPIIKKQLYSALSKMNK